MKFLRNDAVLKGLLRDETSKLLREGSIGEGTIGLYCLAKEESTLKKVESRLKSSHIIMCSMLCTM